MSNKIETKSICELLGMKFFIPNYQRGYRWTKQQVKDLLDDIDEFIAKGGQGFYSIQPLVVKKNIINEEEYCQKLKELNPKDKNTLLEKTEELINKYAKWEVIDGQQRLTTIFILLKYFECKKVFEIDYETRPNSKGFLVDIKKEKAEDNIDYYHIAEAKEQIEDWFNNEKRKNYDKGKFTNTILEKVKFIWYESVNEDPIKVFTRLNIGKIPLTNAELIKALFLNKSNFESADYQKIRLQQQEIAGEWDNIEYTLQNDEFWLFLNKPNYDKPTRIDFIFDLICEKNILKLSDNEIKDIGTVDYQIFRYFYTWFNKKDVDIKTAWREVKNIFQTFQEWFNDLELYHYVGFLIEQKESLLKIFDEWQDKTKKDFIDEYLIKKIKEKIKEATDLEKVYEDKEKTKCSPLLLLHNIQTIINQNKYLTKKQKYKLPVFYKFPFHLFKKEKWDVEHIDSNTENSLDDEKSQKEWLKATLIVLDNEDDLKKDIINFIKKNDDNEDVRNKAFEELYNKVLKKLNIEESENKLNDNEKNKIWNFTLLDASTNRSYGNSIFSVKRRVIIGKDKGKKILVNDNFEVKEKEGAIAFIPPVTKNIFMKYYNPLTNNLREWDRTDAEAYKNNITEILEKFLGNDNK